MSSTFSPIKLDKDLTKTGIKTVFLSILNAPVGAFIGSLMIGALWFLYFMVISPNKGELSPSANIILSVIFVFGQFYLPALFGSYLMYRYTYKQRWLGFWQNVKGAGFVRSMMYDLLFYAFIFTLMHFFFDFITPEKSSESSDVTKPHAQVLISLMFLGFVMVISFYYWLDMSVDKSIALRTGFSSSESGQYKAQAKKLNPRLSRFSARIMILLFLLISLLSLPVFLTGMAFGLVQLLISMFWVYVLFGNTFPTKETVKVAASRPASVTNV